MISEFRVKNFLSIKDEQILSFEPTPDKDKRDIYCHNVNEKISLLKIAIIYGSNASGKTNILLALERFKEIMTSAPFGRSKEINISPFLLDEKSRNEKTEFSMTFYLEGEKYLITIALDKQRIYHEILSYYPTTQPAKLYERKYNSETDATDIIFGTKLKLNKKNQLAILGNTINNCSVLAAFGKSNVELSFLNKVYDFFSTKIDDVLFPHTSLSNFTLRSLGRDEDLKDFVIAFLKASDFNINDIRLKEKEYIVTSELERFMESYPMVQEVKHEVLSKKTFSTPELIFTHNTDSGDFDLPEELESRGTIRFMALAVLLRKLLGQGSIIPIDEIETSLHYELLAYFLKVFLVNDKIGSQLIISTHDINLLNEDFIRRDVIWFTDKDSLGVTHLSRLSDFGLHKNISPYNAYKQGKIVDLPFLGSIYI